MKILLILSRPPFDGTDAAWNALRFAQTARKADHAVRLFLLNAAVDLARPEATPAGAEFNLAEMLRELVRGGAEARLCGTCLTRCGIAAGKTIPEAPAGKMADLVEWTTWADKIVTF